MVDAPKLTSLPNVSGHWARSESVVDYVSMSGMLERSLTIENSGDMFAVSFDSGRPDGTSLFAFSTLLSLLVDLSSSQYVPMPEDMVSERMDMLYPLVPDPYLLQLTKTKLMSGTLKRYSYPITLVARGTRGEAMESLAGKDHVTVRDLLAALAKTCNADWRAQRLPGRIEDQDRPVVADWIAELASTKNTEN